jgi:hypothetical protein
MTINPHAIPKRSPKHCSDDYTPPLWPQQSSHSSSFNLEKAAKDDDFSIELKALAPEKNISKYGKGGGG